MNDTVPASDLRASMLWFALHLEGAVPGYANGGVVAGTLASHLEAGGDRAIEVRLHRPTPLERALSVEHRGPTVRLCDGSEVIATARCVPHAPTVRGPVGVDAARRSHPVVSLDHHPAPGCFVCGPANLRGLNLQPGAVHGRDLVATPWSPPAELADHRGHLPTDVVWAALDCPSWYGAARGAPALLGSITARQGRPVPVGGPVVVSGWGLRRDGRKTMAGSAIHDGDGEPLAVAAAIWIHPKEHAR